MYGRFSDMRSMHQEMRDVQDRLIGITNQRGQSSEQGKSREVATDATEKLRLAPRERAIQSP